MTVYRIVRHDGFVSGQTVWTNKGYAIFEDEHHARRSLAGMRGSPYHHSEVTLESSDVECSELV